LSAKVKVLPTGMVAVGATFGAVAVGDAVPGEALGTGVGLLEKGVTAGVGEAAVDASGGQVGEIGSACVVSDAEGAATEGRADAMTAAAGDTGNAEEGCGGPAKAFPGQAVVAGAGAVPEIVAVVGDAHAAAASSSIGATMRPN
jgi:hypothetical protein